MKKMRIFLFIVNLLRWLLLIVSGILIFVAQALGDGQLNIRGIQVAVVGIILNAIIEIKRRCERQKNDNISDTKE